MQNSFNKGISLGFATIFIVSLILVIACNKSLSFEETIPMPNAPLIINNSELVDIRATDVYTTYDSIQRKIEILDKTNNTVNDVYYITLKSNDFATNIFSQLLNKTFAGTLSIVNNNEVVYYKDNYRNSNRFSTKQESIIMKSNIVPSCKLSVVHNCVANKINQMSIFEYGMCLVAAPECYAGLWASCGWTNCVTGELK